MKKKAGKRLLGLAKLIVFAALMVWVVSRVQFRDSARLEGSGGNAALWGSLRIQGEGGGLFMDEEGKPLLHLEKEVVPGPRGSKKILWKEIETGKV